jgi:hypothetical protein
VFLTSHLHEEEAAETKGNDATRESAKTRERMRVQTNRRRRVVKHGSARMPPQSATNKPKR